MTHDKDSDKHRIIKWAVVSMNIFDVDFDIASFMRAYYHNFHFGFVAYSRRVSLAYQ